MTDKPRSKTTSTTDEVSDRLTDSRLKRSHSTYPYLLSSVKSLRLTVTSDSRCFIKAGVEGLPSQTGQKLRREIES